MTIKIIKRKYVLFFLVILIAMFLLWSKVLWAFLGLVIILDLVSTQFIWKFLNSYLPNTVYTLIKYFTLIILSIYIAVFVRTFFFDVYFVPSISMEQTLLPNDYVLVNKFLYGTKVPNYKTDVPVIGRFFRGDNLEYHHNLYRPLKIFKKFSREDIVVFRSIEKKRQFLVKRIIGLPSDTLKISNAKVYTNNIQLEEKSQYSYNYIDSRKSLFYDLQTFSNDQYNKLSIKEKAIFIKEIKETASNVNEYSIFPESKQNEWTRDNYGEIIIPKKGQRVIISSNNYELYKRIFKAFEKVDFLLKKGESKKYTFKNNYYFVMGDNRHNSIDSRSFGFVPESYIQGKVIAKF